MSAYFNSDAKRLTATLSGSVFGPDDNKLITAWIKWETGQSHNSENWAFAVRDAGETNLIRLYGDSNPNCNGTIKYSSTVGGQGIAGIADNTWILLGFYTPGDVGGTQTVELYKDAASSTNTFSSPNTATVDATELRIGIRYDNNGYTRWKGWVAEPSLWKPTNAAEADAIMAELLTTQASAVTAADPIWYARLFDDASVITGASLTNTGSVTFDSGNHPSLSGGGGSVVPLLLLHQQQL